MQNELSKAPCKEECYVESICTKCDFYDGSDDDLECAGFRILRELVKNDVISLEDIENAKVPPPKRK
jgi:hypothetical protein